MVNTNGRDPAVLQRFREDPVVTSIPGGIDHKATAAQIEHIATLVRKEFDYGADAVIMHGATPDELASIVEVYRSTVG
jgi:hypothetical protein